MGIYIPGFLHRVFFAAFSYAIGNKWEEPMHFPLYEILILFAVKAYCRDVSLTAILLKWRFNFVTGPTEVGKRRSEGAVAPLTSFQKLLPVFPKRCPFCSKKLLKMSIFLNFLTNFAPPVLNYFRQFCCEL